MEQTCGQLFDQWLFPERCWNEALPSAGASPTMMPQQAAHCHILSVYSFLTQLTRLSLKVDDNRRLCDVKRHQVGPGPGQVILLMGHLCGRFLDYIEITAPFGN